MLIVGLDIASGEIPQEVTVLSSAHENRIGHIRAQLDSIAPESVSPVIVRLEYPDRMTAEETLVAASVDFGALLLSDGDRIDGVWLDTPVMNANDNANLMLGILQAARIRISKTEFIACPGCGRTLFDLPSVLKEIKANCSHLKGLKIGVMGCIVNGPGEMADADYGYVGAAAGKVSLYKGKTCVEKNIPAAEALPRLIELIKSNGDWIDRT